MALFGAETRHRLINLIDEVEAEIGQCAFAIDEDTGAMEINPKLIERFRKEADCGVLESVFDLAFPSPASKRSFNEGMGIRGWKASWSAEHQRTA